MLIKALIISFVKDLVNGLISLPDPTSSMNTNITMNTDTNDFVKAPQTITNANKNKPPKLPLVIMVVTVVTL